MSSGSKVTIFELLRTADNRNGAFFLMWLSEHGVKVVWSVNQFSIHSKQ